MSPAASLMVKQEELALLRAVSSGQGNPVFLRDLRKALAAKKAATAAVEALQAYSYAPASQPK